MAATDIVGSPWVTASTGSTSATSATHSTTTGNSILVFVPYEGATGSVVVSSVTDSKGNTYAAIASSAITHSGGEPAGVWYLCSGHTGDAALAVTANFSGSPGLGLIVCYELEGAVASDGVGTGQGSGVTFSTSSINTTAAGMVLLGIAGYQVLATPAGGGTPTFTYDSATAEITSFCCHYASASAQTITPGASWAAPGDRWVASAVALKAGSAQAPAEPPPLVMPPLLPPRGRR